MELPGASLGPTSAQALVQMLLAEEQQPWLVNLEGNELGDKGAVCLAELVRHSRELVWLDLGSNGIGPVGGVALAEALATSPSLTALDLSSSPSTCRHRNVLGRKVRDGEEPLQAAPSADPLEGGLRQRGRPRSAPPGAGLPRAAPRSAPVLSAGPPAEWAGVTPGPPEALLLRLKDGYLLTPEETARLVSAGEVAAVLEDGDPHFAHAARRWKVEHKALLAELPKAAPHQKPRFQRAPSCRSWV